MESYYKVQSNSIMVTGKTFVCCDILYYMHGILPCMAPWEL